MHQYYRIKIIQFQLELILEERNIKYYYQNCCGCSDDDTHLTRNSNPYLSLLPAFVPLCLSLIPVLLSSIHTFITSQTLQLSLSFPLPESSQNLNCTNRRSSLARILLFAFKARNLFLGSVSQFRPSSTQRLWLKESLISYPSSLPRDTPLSKVFYLQSQGCCLSFLYLLFFLCISIVLVYLFQICYLLCLDPSNLNL